MNQTKTDQKGQRNQAKERSFDWFGKWPPVCAGLFHQPKRPISLSEKCEE